MKVVLTFDPLKGFWGSHFENHVLGCLLISKWEFVSTYESSFFSLLGIHYPRNTTAYNWYEQTLELFEYKFCFVNIIELDIKESTQVL